MGLCRSPSQTVKTTPVQELLGTGPLTSRLTATSVQVVGAGGPSYRAHLLGASTKDIQQMSAQTGTSPADTPKVISVDLALRGAVALLLTLLLSVSGWMLYRLIDHGERIGRLEELSLRDLSDRGELLSELRGLRTMLGQMQANQSEFRIEIKNLKDLLSAHERSERDK